MGIWEGGFKCLKWLKKRVWYGTISYSDYLIIDDSTKING